MDLSDPITFSRIYADNIRGVQAAAHRILGDTTLAQDVAQDVFLKVWRRPGAFDERRGELGSYLRLMARSRALDLWREQQAAGRATDRLKLVVAEQRGRPDDQPAQSAEREETHRTVIRALRSLPENQREPVALAYWAGMTTEELARRAGVPLGTAKSRVRLGLAKLRGELDAPPHAEAA
ncbi:MAG TPA: sigma-70 family RNA polymerase sigma factor [Solirubrobacteraceae bacterium]|nr:sigma-70 family RNA polymerase sigma factor [Solirubrobacteraceae bacterium]